MNPTTKRFALFLLACITVAVSILSACSSNGTPRISPQELENLVRSGNPLLILDVRTPKEFSKGHVPGAVNIPHKKLEARLGELAVHKSGEIVVYCRSGRRTAIAERILDEAGFSRIRVLKGQIGAWQKAGFPVEE